MRRLVGRRDAVQQVADAVPGLVVEQQAAEDRLFGLDGMRRDAQLRDLAVGRRVVAEVASMYDVGEQAAQIDLDIDAVIPAGECP